MSCPFRMTIGIFEYSCYYFGSEKTSSEKMQHGIANTMNDFCTVLYLAYGGWQFRKQAVVSISSLLGMGPIPGKIIAFTDRPRDFERLPIEIIHISQEQIKKWKGPYGFTHRLKMELVLDVLKKSGNSVVYVDSDTFWIRNPGNIFRFLEEGFPVMHMCEQPVADHFFPEYRELVKKKPLLEQAGIPTSIPEQIWIYNAGVIGLPGDMDPELPVQAMALCDLLSRHVPFKMEWVEQFAFSYIFQSLGFEIKTCAEDLCHYWRDSFEFGRQIRSFSQETLIELGRDGKHIRQLIETGSRQKRSFYNQLLVRTKRLIRSCKRRKRESLVFAEKLRRWMGLSAGDGGIPGH